MTLFEVFVAVGVGGWGCGIVFWKRLVLGTGLDFLKRRAFVRFDPNLMDSNRVWMHFCGFLKRIFSELLIWDVCTQENRKGFLKCRFFGLFEKIYESGHWKIGDFRLKLMKKKGCLG